MLRKMALCASVTLALFAAAPVAASAAPVKAAPVAQKPCIGIGKIGVQSLIGLVNIGLQDIPILTSPQQAQCADNSTINDGELSHLLDEIPVISGNGSANG